MWHLLAFTLCLGICSASGAAFVVPLSGAEDRLALAPYARVLKDKSGTLSLAQAMDAASDWQANDEAAVRIGLTQLTWWIRVPVVNATDAPQAFIVDLGSMRQDHVRWILLDAAGQVRLDHVTGDRLPYATRLVDFHGMGLPLALQPGERMELVVRLQSHDGLIEPVPIKVSSTAPFHRSLRASDMLLSVYFGALLALAIYNLFLFASTRNVQFLAYVVYAGALLAWNVGYMGIGFEFLWPRWPIVNHKLALLMGGVVYGSAAWFIPTYLRLTDMPSMHRVVALYRLVRCLCVAIMVLAALDFYAATVIASLVVGVPMLVGTLLLSVRLARAGHREGYFLAIAVFSLVPGSVAFYAHIFGWLPYSEIGKHGIQLSSFAEMMLLSLGLADSMNSLKAEKLAAEQRALEAQRILSTDLERQVGERTRALEKANSLLGEMAITDELTGAYNRRHFNQYCSDLLGRPTRSEPMAMCMFDIDHFKRFNDRYGHQAGDAVLRDVAHAVASVLKRSGDHLFRLGGEEFGVLFSMNTPEQALEFVEQMRLSIRDLRRLHEDSSLGCVTASFGIAWWPLQGLVKLSPDHMYATADEALYDAKHAGRDCVTLRVLASMPF